MSTTPIRRPVIASFHHRDFRLPALVDAKGDLTVSVCVPARDEEATVGRVVRTVRHHLVEATGLVDEIVVLDDHSTDATAEVAAEAGARVVAAADVLADVAGGPGKGEALWRSLHVTKGDIVLWADADILDFGPHFITGLLGPLLTEPEVSFVKGFYERPVGDATRGGRTTELVARPVIAALLPHLSTIVQPLAGEFGGRRTLLEQVPFVRGYGVDLGLLIDVADLAGPGAIAQVDLGTRRHRNRTLDELGPQALAVLQTALERVGVDQADPAYLVRPGLPPLEQSVGELPPLVSLTGGQRKRDGRRVTLTRVPTAAQSLTVHGRTLDLAEPVLMGIVNATPDSFSDAGLTRTVAERVALAVDLVGQGAGIVDVGGQSGITGVPEIPVEEEIARVVPVIEGIRDELPDITISVDTYRPAVVEAALAAGADIVNDISGLLHPEVAELCAAARAGLIVMHTRARPKHKVLDPDLYDDVTGDVVELLAAKVEEAVSRGVPREAIIVDPGPDFAKTPAQTVQVLREIDRVRALGHPVLLALSRKDFIGAITGRPPRRRLAGTLAAIGHLLGTPGHILRVHDVEAVADFLKVAAVLGGRADIPRDAQLAPDLRHEPAV